MKILKKVASVISIIVLILMFPLTEKDTLDINMAEEILKSTYEPLITIATEGSYNDQYYFKPDIEIDKATFINYFPNMKKHQAESLYDSLQDGLDNEYSGLINGKVYIPTVYDETSVINKAFVSKKRVLIDYILNRDTVEYSLVIKEKWGSDLRRTYYYEMNKGGQWILDRANGTASYTFVDIKNNPWHSLRD